MVTCLTMQNVMVTQKHITCNHISMAFLVRSFSQVVLQLLAKDLSYLSVFFYNVYYGFYKYFFNVIDIIKRSPSVGDKNQKQV